MSDAFATFAASPLPHSLDLIEITPSDSAVLDPMPRALRIEAFAVPISDLPADEQTAIDPETVGSRTYAAVRVTPATAASDSVGDSVLLRFPLTDQVFGFALHVLPCRVRKVWATDTTDNVSIVGLV